MGDDGKSIRSAGLFAKCKVHDVLAAALARLVPPPHLFFPTAAAKTKTRQGPREVRAPQAPGADNPGLRAKAEKLRLLLSLLVTLPARTTRMLPGRKVCLFSVPCTTGRRGRRGGGGIRLRLARIAVDISSREL